MLDTQFSFLEPGYVLPTAGSGRLTSYPETVARTLRELEDAIRTTQASLQQISAGLVAQQITLVEQKQALYTLSAFIKGPEYDPAGPTGLAHRRIYCLPEPKTGRACLLSRREVAKQKYGGLTTREREVATMITQGKFNREIAGALFVGLKTMEAHTTRILSKLGFASRAQITAWAVAKGLAEAPHDLDILARED